MVSRRARQEAVRAAHPWLAQLERERAWTRALLALWLAGRSYQLERSSRRSHPA